MYLQLCECKKTAWEYNSSSEMTQRGQNTRRATSRETDRDEGGLPLIMATPSEEGKMAMLHFATRCLAKGVSTLLQEFEKLSQESPKANEVPHSSFSKNPRKNRYVDIICAEATRVTLCWPPNSKAGDYIHANWIKNMPDMAKKQLIATQGPNANTIEDFWRMVWQEKCAAIVMLCNTMENGKKKCDQYWPETINESINYGAVQVTNTGQGDMGKGIIYTKLKLTALGSNGVLKDHLVNHIIWTEWPDKGIPTSTTGAIRVVLRTQMFTPSIVHCSAGVGRTGTIIALECCLRMLSAGHPPEVYNVIKDLRSRRFLCCQTGLQYIYIHRALIQYIISKEIIDLDQASPWLGEYERLLRASDNSPTAG